MASTAEEEQAYLDGTHPALVGGIQPHSHSRPGSPSSNHSITPTSSASSSPRFKALDPDPPTSSIPPMNSTKGGASNTGPKGVLADWKAARNGGAASHTGPKGVLADFNGMKAANGIKAIENINPDGSSGGIRIISLDSLELDDDEDEESGKGEEEKAIESYRRKRMMELSGSGSLERNGRSSRKTFGHLREIGMDQFLSAIEDEHPDVAVVLHLYEPHIETCAMLNHHLSSIARDYPSTKFLRALATEVDFAADSEDDTLPTVLVYRGGELETTLVRIDHEWGTGARAEIIELLQRNNAIADVSPVVQSRESREDSDEYE